MPTLNMTPFQRHKIRWKNCTRCELHCFRKKTVLLRGNIPAPMLFIGEAPGNSEDVLGSPFIGPAGKLLDKIVDRTRVEAGCCAFTNLIGCIPKDETNSKVSDPPKWAIEACSSRITEVVELCKPHVIVLVGKCSAKYGPKIIEDNLPTVTIIHPATILHMNVSQQSLAVQRCAVTIDDAWEKHVIPF